MKEEGRKEGEIERKKEERKNIFEKIDKEVR